MTQTQARSWAYAAAAAGVIANALFIAFYASFAVQHFAGPRGVAAILASPPITPVSRRTCCWP
jgi:hypothetical protein